MRVSIIAAMAKNRVIGVENRLPWHLPEDLKNFKKVTLGHPVIMGRKTFDSIGRPLPGRQNIILSRKADLKIPGVWVFQSLKEALEACQGLSEEVFVIGGAEIYQMSLERADRLYLTWVDCEPRGDAFFPKWNDEDFNETSRESHAGSPLAYQLIILDRKR